MNGKFISFEGGEGAGKSTQVRLLAESLRQAGIRVVQTREPGGAPGAEDIRALLVTGDPDRWDGITETLLHTAARHTHLVETVWPALHKGAWVVTDRFVDSTIAYQGVGHGIGRDVIARFHDLANKGFMPDLTLMLDLPVEIGLQRALQRAGVEDRYERMDVQFHHRLRAGFLDIARAEPERCAIIDATGDVETVQAAIFSVVAERLGVAVP